MYKVKNQEDKTQTQTLPSKIINHVTCEPFPRLSVYPARISFLLFRTSEEFSVLYMFLYISYPPYLAFSYVSWHSSCNQKLLPTPRYCLMYVYYMSKGNVRLSQSSCSSDHNVFYRLEQHFCIYLHHKLW